MLNKEGLPIPELFDLEAIFLNGLAEYKTMKQIIDDLTGDRFIVSLQDKVFIRELNATHYELYNISGVVVGTREFVGEERTFLQLLSVTQIQHFLAQQHVAKLAEHIKDLEKKPEPLKATDLLDMAVSNDKGVIYTFEDEINSSYVRQNRMVGVIENLLTALRERGYNI